jgi:hypothetical protein
MAETHKPNTLARVEIRRAPPYMLIQRGPRRPSKRRPAHTGEKATRFPLTASPSAEGQVAGSNPLGPATLGVPNPARSASFPDPRSKIFLWAP